MVAVFSVAAKSLNRRLARAVSGTTMCRALEGAARIAVSFFICAAQDISPLFGRRSNGPGDHPRIGLRAGCAPCGCGGLPGAERAEGWAEVRGAAVSHDSGGPTRVERVAARRSEEHT